MPAVVARAALMLRGPTGCGACERNLQAGKAQPPPGNIMSTAPDVSPGG